MKPNGCILRPYPPIGRPNPYPPIFCPRPRPYPPYDVF